MTDYREFIRDLLLTIEYDKPFKVLPNFPKSQNDGVIISFAEQSNISTRYSVVDDITYAINVWAYDLETLIDLSNLADEKLTGIGFRRTFCSPDDKADNSGYYRKILYYNRKVDKRYGCLID